MSIKNPTFAQKSSAIRAAKRAALNNYDVILTADDRFELRDLSRPLYNHSARKKSNVKGAVAIVWDLCAAMIPNGAKRRDIVTAAVDAGVALNTAKTQYQYYRKAIGLVKSDE